MSHSTRDIIFSSLYKKKRKLRVWPAKLLNNGAAQCIHQFCAENSRSGLRKSIFQASCLTHPILNLGDLHPNQMPSLPMFSHGNSSSSSWGGCSTSALQQTPPPTQLSRVVLSNRWHSNDYAWDSSWGTAAPQHSEVRMAVRRKEIHFSMLIAIYFYYLGHYIKEFATP